MKKIVISGYYGFNNFGDEISLQVIVKTLQDQGIDVTVLSSNPEMTVLTHGVISLYTFSIFDIIRQIFVSDALISGGGSLLQDKTSIKSFLYYIFVILTAKFLGKKIIIFSQGFAPLKNKYLERILKYVLANTSYISVRDKESKDYILDLGVKPSKVKAFCDCVWALEKKPIERENNVIIQIRDWVDLTEDKLDILARMIARQFSSSSIRLLSLQDAKDLKVINLLADKLQKFNLDVKILKGLNINQIEDVIASAKYLIAMRYHACLLGIKYNVPTLAISYDEKVSNLAQKFNLSYVYVDEENELFAIELRKSLEYFTNKIVDLEILQKEEISAKKSLYNLINVINNIEVEE